MWRRTKKFSIGRSACSDYLITMMSFDCFAWKLNELEARAFAKKATVNVSVVSKTLRGIVLPSEKILSALNLRVVYLSK